MKLSSAQKCSVRQSSYCPDMQHIRVRSFHTKHRHLLRFQVLNAAQLDSEQSTGQKGTNKYKCVIVGAGISGLSNGLALKKQYGMDDFIVTESRDSVGGNVTSRSNDTFVWEEGPNSFQPSDAVLQAAVDAECQDDLVLGDPTAPRFVFWEGILRQVPSDILSGITTNLLSPWGKIRLGLGAVGILKQPPPPQPTEESVEQFIRRNLGEEMFQRLIEPFCSGVYAGDPAKLGMKAAFKKIQVLEENGGSLVGGAIKLLQDRKANPPPSRNPELPPKPEGQTVGSFKKGLIMLPKAIEKKLEGHVRLNWTLNSIKKCSNNQDYELRYSTLEGDVSIETQCVVLTCPSYIAQKLLCEVSPKASEALSDIDYPPVAAVTLAYPVSDVREERKQADGFVPGFGQLHPRTQGIVTLGTIYSSSLFPGRAPQKMILVLNYIGGATNRAILDMPEEDLVKQVDKDVRKMLIKEEAGPPTVVGLRVWPKAIPQFNIGHMDKLSAAQSGLEENGCDTIFLGGNYVYGVAFGKCIEASYEMAKTVSERCAKLTS
eukprot:TRINITY_DN6015_c0_g1_i8.p1 TRINITY_DN6015_c0_g1~~TRINITY_DN6015_c0_g1_i8.p1  ORF type:complete len:544 (-),score=91.86 TRINITY_DN6015_c0_g1_i8:1984-3615(-)